jgi:hypothetical protein
MLRRNTRLPLIARSVSPAICWGNERRKPSSTQRLELGPAWSLGALALGPSTRHYYCYMEGALGAHGPRSTGPGFEVWGLLLVVGCPGARRFLIFVCLLFVVADLSSMRRILVQSALALLGAICTRI